MAVKEMLGGALDLFGWKEVPQGWQFDLLGNRCSIRRGSSPRPAGDPKYFGGGTIPWIKIGDATKTGGRYIDSTEEFVNEEGAKCSVRIPAGSLVIANSGVSLGFAAITRIEGCIHDGWLLLTDFRELDRRYLYYCINLVTHKIRHFADGTTQPNLNTDIARRLLLPMPPLREQKALAKILGTLDDKIELNRRMNETLEAMARALFKSWFVDFDPVRAKAEGRDPGLPKHLADLFPSCLVDSELGEIPAGWDVASFASIVEILGGGTPKTSIPEYWGGEIRWFSVVDAPRDSDVFVLDTEKRITHAGLVNSSTQILPEGTTIITARGTVGKVALVGVPMAMNQSCYGLRGRTGERGFLTYYATRALVSTLQQRVHGSVFDTITRDTVAGADVVVPPVSLVEAFERAVAPVLERIRNNLFESHTLAALRDTLLPKLISGELRVKDVDPIIAEVT